MLYSMTGFGSELVTVEVSGMGRVCLAIEIKTINSRFFEAVCKLPNVLSALEVKLINVLQKKLLRGRVYLTVKFGEDNEAFENLEPSLKNVQAYLLAAKTISDAHGIPSELTVRDLFMLPNIFVSSKTALNEEHEQLIISLVDRVAAKVMQTRAEEGTTLRKDFNTRFGVCRTSVVRIKGLFETIMANLKLAVDEKLVQCQAEPSDQLKIQLDDLYSTLNKCDIHEEITRFNSHLTAVEALLAHEQIEKGKRLDFILQELLRETNTIMAKCTNYDISSVGVDIKVELEKAREQVQNII